MFCCGRVRNRDEDEGIPSENEEEKKMLDTKARELKGEAGGSGPRACQGSGVRGEGGAVTRRGCGEKGAQSHRTPADFQLIPELAGWARTREGDSSSQKRNQV